MGSPSNDDRLSSLLNGDDSENSGRHSTYSKNSVLGAYFLTDDESLGWLPTGSCGPQLPIGKKWPPERVVFHFTADDQAVYSLTLVGANPDDFAKLLKRFAEGRQWMMLPGTDGIASIACEPLQAD